MERLTKQRVAVYENVCSRYDHPTAYDIFSSVRENIPNVSLTTVYRNLNNLADEGLILRLTVPGMPDRFDKTVTPHFHILCECCGGFKDLDDSGLFEKVRLHLLNQEDFALDCLDVVYKGKCKQCRNKII